MLGLPSTGGQKVAQVPLHFDEVGVSIANQYSVRPCELTRTVPLLVLAVLMPLADAAVVPAVLPELDPPPDPPDPLLELVGLLVLPQAASRPTAAATTGAAHHRFIISISPFPVRCS
jgi:hypothetical protein